MTTGRRRPAPRLEQERERDRAARREVVRRNARMGVGRNLEDAIRLLESAEELRAAFDRDR